MRWSAALGGRRLVVVGVVVAVGCGGSVGGGGTSDTSGRDALVDANTVALDAGALWDGFAGGGPGDGPGDAIWLGVDGSTSQEAGQDSSTVTTDAMSPCYSATSCIMCSADGDWHCQSLVEPQCPANVGPGGACPGFGAPDGSAANCITCDHGAATTWACLTNGTWARAGDLGQCAQ
jgi:hypothetical protein